MNFADDKILQALSDLIQHETDPQKLSECAEAFNRRLTELQSEASRSSDPAA